MSSFLPLKTPDRDAFSKRLETMDYEELLGARRMLEAMLKSLEEELALPGVGRSSTGLIRCSSSGFQTRSSNFLFSLVINTSVLRRMCPAILKSALRN